MKLFWNHATQTPANAVLARGLRSPVKAAAVTFVIGPVGLMFAAALLQIRPEGGAIRVPGGADA